MVFIYVWLIILVLCVVVEALTATLVTIWFIPASLVALILAAFDVATWLQVLAFVLIGVGLLVFTKPVFEKLLRSRPIEMTNSMALIGKRAVVCEDIDNLAERGAVKIEGKVWTARTASDEEKIYSGDVVEILEIRGVKLICKKL